MALAPASRMHEAELLAEVMRLCASRGLPAFHCHDSRRSAGKGFPDLVIAGLRGVLYRELKDHRAELSEDQERWRDVLEACGADWGLWRPADLHSGKIAFELSIAYLA